MASGGRIPGKRRINIKRYANDLKRVGHPTTPLGLLSIKLERGGGGSATLNDETAFPAGFDLQVADGRSFVVQSLVVAAFEVRRTYFASCIQLG